MYLCQSWITFIMSYMLSASLRSFRRCTFQVLRGCIQEKKVNYASEPRKDNSPLFREKGGSHYFPKRIPGSASHSLWRPVGRHPPSTHLYECPTTEPPSTATTSMFHVVYHNCAERLQIFCTHLIFPAFHSRQLLLFREASSHYQHLRRELDQRQRSSSL